MRRQLYIALLEQHPKTFRERFGAEMLAIFDESREKTPLLLDAIASVVRQWFFRTQEAPLQHATEGVPRFYVGEDERPGRAAMFEGAILSLVFFALIGLVLSHRWEHLTLIVGSHHPSPSHLLGVKTNAVATSELPATVTVRPYPDKMPESAYFKMMPVLHALDVDRDNVISPGEIKNASAVLRTLDRNHDGVLDPEECGLDFGGAPVTVEFRAKAALRFMRFHPVLATLDADRDGVISEREIANAPALLRRLDKNGDGALTEDELLPPSPQRKRVR
jgi:hypothetical protein